MSDCGSLLSSYINLCPLTPNSKTHASIRMTPRSPCPLVTEQAKVKRRAAEWRWHCGNEICLWCTLHIFFLFMPLHHANTRSVKAIHLHTEGGGRPPAHTERGGQHHSTAGQRPVGCLAALGSVLVFERRWVMTVSHLDRDAVKLLDTRDSQHVAVLSYICEWGDFCACKENWS